MSTRQNPQISSLHEGAIDDVAAKEQARIDYYHKGIGYRLISAGWPACETVVATVQTTTPLLQDSSDPYISPSLNRVPAPIPQDTIGSFPPIMGEPGHENATQQVDQSNPDQRTASTSRSCDHMGKEQQKTFRRPSPNWETVQPLAPVEQIASFNPVRRRRWKLMLFIGLCLAGTAVVGWIIVPGLLSHHRLDIASVTASNDVHLIRKLPTATLITESKHEPISSEPARVQSKTQVATSIAAMPAEQSEAGAPFSFDARTSSSMTAELQTPTVQAVPSAAATGADAPQENAAASSDVRTSPGELLEPPIVSVLERPPKTVIGAPTYVRPSAEALVVPSEPNTNGPRITKIESDALLSRGDTLLRAGDVTSARLYYQTGADAGDGAAALRLGETFDPEFLKRAHLGLVRGDPAKAMDWYRRAAELDNPDAKLLLGNISVSDR